MSIHLLERRQIVTAPIAECWAFFSDPRNLRKITPPRLDMQMLTSPTPVMAEGVRIRYRVRPLCGIPLQWLAEITRVEAPLYFCDEQRAGPYALWRHEHFFEEAPGGATEVRDRVHYALPFGLLGDAVNSLVVERQLKEIFDHRKRAVRQLWPEMKAPDRVD